MFQKKAKRRLISHPKFYFFDAGVYRALRPRGPLDTPEDIDGAVLETVVRQEIRAMNQLEIMAISYISGALPQVMK